MWPVFSGLNLLCVSDSLSARARGSSIAGPRRRFPPAWGDADRKDANALRFCHESSIPDHLSIHLDHDRGRVIAAAYI